MITPLLFVLLQAAPAIPADLAAELKNIKTEQAAIEAENKDITLAQAQLTKSAGHIADTESLRDRGIATLLRERAALAKEVDAHQADAAQQVAAATILRRDVQNYNARCDRKFDRETEMAQYQACVAEEAALRARIDVSDAWARRVDASKSRLTAKGDALQKQQETLEEIDRGIEGDRRNLASTTDAVNARITKLETRRTKLGERRNKALAQLAAVNAISKDCAEVALRITADSCKPVGDPSDPANWNTPCEQAARCLQKAWDGAR